MTNKVELEVVGVPSEVADRLQALHTRHSGLLRETDVVADAKKKNSPLHSYFEWDDRKASEAYRLEQASALIRRVKVKVIVEPETPPIRVRAFIANRDVANETVDDVESGTYRSIHDVVENKGYRDAIEDAMRRDLLQLQVKYNSHRLFFELLRDMAG